MPGRNAHGQGRRIPDGRHGMISNRIILISTRARVNPNYDSTGQAPCVDKLAFTRACHCQYCMVYSMAYKRGVGGGCVLRNRRAIVFQ